MMRRVMAPLAGTGLALAVLAGPLAAQGSRVRIAVAGHAAPVIVDSLATRFVLAAPRAATWTAVQEAFKALEVQPDLIDPARGMLGMTNVPKMRRLGRQPLSRLVSCGSGMMGPNADNWRVYLTVYAFVDAVGTDSTALRLAVVGGAKDVAGSSTDAVPCASTGALEEQLGARVRRALADPAPR